MLLDAIYSVVQKQERWMSPRALETTLPASTEEQTLTNREVNILRQLLISPSEAEIAQALQMEEKHVGSYLKLLMQKFETESLDELRAVARRILPSQGARDKSSPGRLRMLF